MGFFVSIVLQLPAPTQVAMLYPNAFEYGRIRAQRDISPAHYRVWIESRPLVGLDPSDDADWDTV